jgi:ribonuclease BN (tRNA processing enzyme)
LQVADLASHLRFRNLPGGGSRRPFRFGRLEVRWCPVQHPGGCSAYRIDEPDTGGSCVIATDVEWSLASPELQRAFREFCVWPGPPDILLLDGQYDPGEYRKRRGWGHSTWKQSADVARAVGARRLLVTHHDPGKNDRRLALTAKKLDTYCPGARLAREGVILNTGRR